jgi:S-phase kinase-associated protein 1
MSDDQIIHLVTDDGTTFDVRRDVIRLSEYVKMLLPTNDADEEEIPVPGVEPGHLAKVIEFCEHYKDSPMEDIEKVRELKYYKANCALNLFLKPLKSCNMHEVVGTWYADFLAIDQETIFSLILAANSMNIKPLLDLTCAAVASLIKGRTVEEIRKVFGIVNDFTEEEEAQIREENRWAEDA